VSSAFKSFLFEELLANRGYRLHRTSAGNLRLKKVSEITPALSKNDWLYGVLELAKREPRMALDQVLLEQGYLLYRTRAGKLRIKALSEDEWDYRVSKRRFAEAKGNFIPFEDYLRKHGLTLEPGPDGKLRIMKGGVPIH
jgi:hypothetical protein